MDSINLFKGYGKVGAVEEPALRRKTRNLIIITTVSLLILLGFIVGIVLGITSVDKNNTEPSETNYGRRTPTSMTTVAESIRAVCNVTRYQELCLSSLSSAVNESSSSNNNKADPEELLKLSLVIALKDLSNVSLLPEKLIGKAKDARDEAALRDCQSLLEEAIGELNRSISSMEVMSREKLPSASKMNDMKTWVSGAMTNQQTCLDGLQEVNSTLLEEVKIALKNSTELSSNGLAIVANILTLIADFDAPIHHRKLLGFDFDVFTVTESSNGVGDYLYSYLIRCRNRHRTELGHLQRSKKRT